MLTEVQSGDALGVASTQRKVSRDHKTVAVLVAEAYAQRDVLLKAAEAQIAARVGGALEPVVDVQSEKESRLAWIEWHAVRRREIEKSMGAHSQWDREKLDLEPRVKIIKAHLERQAELAQLLNDSRTETLAESFIESEIPTAIADDLETNPGKKPLPNDR